MIGQTITHYRILEQLGEGGMGVVYKAEDLRLKHFVALNFLPPDTTSDPETKTRLISEAQAASATDHPKGWGSEEAAMGRPHQNVGREGNGINIIIS